MDGVPDMTTILSLLKLIDMSPSTGCSPDHTKNGPDHPCIIEEGWSEWAFLLIFLWVIGRWGNQDASAGDKNSCQGLPKLGNLQALED